MDKRAAQQLSMVEPPQRLDRDELGIPIPWYCMHCDRLCTPPTGRMTWAGPICKHCDG